MKNTVQKMLVALGLCMAPAITTLASSHREAPLIAYDPQADNTDLYAFKNPNDSSKIIIIANYIPFEQPQGGPNWYTFGNNVRYEIHIKNSTATTTDDILYRFTFTTVNEDPTTFFNIRLGKQNQKQTYTLEKIIGGGSPVTIVSGGKVPPPNIGPRSIEGGAGLGAKNYDSLMFQSIMTANTGERVFAGPIDDPFFVDLGGAFDLGGFRQPGRDGLAKMNCHSLVMEVPITLLQKGGQPVTAATSILDPNYVIGIWASASRQSVQTLSGTGTATAGSGTWVQISRLGMPLTNEVIIPIGKKDLWNSVTPNGTNAAQFYTYYRNPELALYVDTSTNGFGKVVPGLSNYLHIQSASRPTVALGPFDFRNGKPGLFPLKGNPALVGTAFDPATYGGLLLPDNVSPRSADILPIFLTGVPNLAPYQLAIATKGGNPLAAGKPFINNFLPVVGDMLRLNMATPATPRMIAGAPNTNFSTLGVLGAAYLGLTNATYNTTNNIQSIPNMDGFPNGRRLEDDVTTIELMAVGGIVLAAVGLPYDDYTPGVTASTLTPTFQTALTFNAGVTKNDTTFKSTFPFVQQPWRGFGGATYSGPLAINNLSLSAPEAIMAAYPNPFIESGDFQIQAGGRWQGTD